MNGVATLANVSLSGIAGGSYPTGVAATFAGDSTYKASSANATTIVDVSRRGATVIT